MVMSREHVDHKHIQDFSDSVVNLKREDAKEYRDQVNRLRDKISKFAAENRDFELKKMLLSGSLAKHTALKNINDADVAIYLVSAPEDLGELIDWLAEKLRHSFPNLKPEQVVKQNYSVKIEFRGTALDVDVVPVYQTDADRGDWGQVVSQEDGTKIKTNVALHKEFIADYRKNYCAYAQAVRLLKWWTKTRKEENSRFKFKSFMVELVLAKLFDKKAFLKNDDYPEIMLGFFDYISKTDFGETIYFLKHADKPRPCGDAVRVFDPVNSDNNVARKYGKNDRDVIVEEAMNAGDAVEAALKAPTKELTAHYWRKVFGSSFRA